MNAPEAIVYARVSTAQQEDGTSLDTQADACLELAESLGYRVEKANILRDRGTGADSDRTGMVNLRSILELGQTKCVVAYSPDRIARDPVHLLIFREYLEPMGVDLRFVHGPTGDSPEDRLIEYMLGYVGHRERLEIIERTNRGKRRVASEGRLPNGTGAGLYGYDYDKETKSRRINEYEAFVVRRVFDECVAGKTAYAIASELNELGIKTKKSCQWGTETVRRLLINPAYKGETWYGKVRHQLVKGGRRKTTPRPESEWTRVEGFTPRIVSDSLYQQAQEMLAMPSTRRRRGKEPSTFLLTSFIRCELCNHAVTGATGNGKYRYYRCRAAVPDARRQPTCNAKSIPADNLEVLVWDYLANLISNPALIAQNLAEYLDADGGGLKLETDRLKQKIARAKERESRLVSLFADGRYDREIVDDQIRRIKIVRDELESQLVALQQQQSLREDDQMMEQRIADYCRQLSAGLHADSFEGKRAAFAALGVKVVASKESVVLNVQVDPEFTTIAHTSASRRERSSCLIRPAEILPGWMSW